MNLEKLKCVVKLGSIKINCIIAEVDENSLIKYSDLLLAFLDSKYKLINFLIFHGLRSACIVYLLNGKVILLELSTFKKSFMFLKLQPPLQKNFNLQGFLLIGNLCTEGAPK